MSSLVAYCIQELETQGWTILRGNLSQRLLSHFARGYPAPNPSELILVRQAYDGLPMRIVEGLVEQAVLSAVRYGAEEQWHRGRDDTVRGGAPADFIPGFDLAATLDSAPCALEVISGSQRLGVDDPYPLQQSRSIELASGDLAIMDSRLLRRWSAQSAYWILWFSVIRPWLTPLDDFTDKIRPDTPPRALRFYGIPWRPARDVGQWLFHSHSKRNSDARTRS